jgi:hypothetical protein
MPRTARSGARLIGHLNAFYAERPDIPPHRRPNLIHVAGKYLIVRADRDGVLEGNKIEKGQCFTLFGAPDVQAITVAVHNIQYRAAHSNHILYDYQFLIDRATEVLRNEPSASEASHGHIIDPDVIVVVE